MIPYTHIRAAEAAIYSADYAGIKDGAAIAKTVLEALPYAELLAFYEAVTEAGYVISRESGDAATQVEQKLKALEGK